MTFSLTRTRVATIFFCVSYLHFIAASDNSPSKLREEECINNYLYQLESVRTCWATGFESQYHELLRHYIRIASEVDSSDSPSVANLETNQEFIFQARELLLSYCSTEYFDRSPTGGSTDGKEVTGGFVISYTFFSIDLSDNQHDYGISPSAREYGRSIMPEPVFYPADQYFEGLSTDTSDVEDSRKLHDLYWSHMTLARYGRVQVENDVPGTSNNKILNGCLRTLFVVFRFSNYVFSVSIFLLSLLAWRIRAWGFKLAVPPEVLILRPNVIDIRIINLVQTISHLIYSLFRPPLKAGYKRIEWNCDCGQRLYADFDMIDLDAMETVQQELLDGQQTTEEMGQLETLPPVISSSAEQYPSYDPRPGTNGVQTQRQSDDDNSQPGDQGLPNHIKDRPTSIRSPRRFIELCVNTGEFERRLGEIDVSDARGDGDLFTRVREKYDELRSFRVKFFLFKPVNVHYVHFSLEDRHRVGILDEPLAIPTTEDLARDGYGYQPCPLKPPPIPSNIFLHYFSRRHPQSRLIWGRRIPQKIGQSILQQMQAPDDILTGWGIRIVEGLNRVTILLISLMILLSSGIISIVWTVVRHDPSGGFAIGAWVLSVQTISLMLILAKWSEL